MRAALYGSAAATLVMGAALLRPLPPPPAPGSLRLPAPAPSAAMIRVPDAELVDSGGRTFRLGALKGRPWVGAFIFSRCGGQCPLMTSRMKRLRSDVAGIRLVSFSVDPADTPERLGRFAATFGADWLFLHGAPGRVEALSREAFKLAVGRGSDPREPILHSNRLVLVDSEGALRGYYDPADESDLRRLIHDARSLL